MDMVMLDDEKIIREGKANSFTFINSRGGKLAITDRRVLWQGHGFNVGAQADIIELKNIAAYGKCATISIFNLLIPIPNAFYISTNDGKTYKYTVYKRKEWLAALDKAVKDSKK